MKTNVAITSINSFHGVVQSIRAAQHRKILRVMRRGRTYTGQQLCRLTGLTPNVISARLFELREQIGVLERDEKKKVCPYSHQEVFAHRKTGKYRSTNTKNAAGMEGQFANGQKVAA